MSKDKPPLTDKINEFHAILPLENNFLTLNLQSAYFVWSKMSVKGIIRFLGMNNTRLERKILIILEIGFYLPIYHCALPLIKFQVNCYTHLQKSKKMREKMWKKLLKSFPHFFTHLSGPIFQCFPSFFRLFCLLRIFPTT